MLKTVNCSLLTVHCKNGAKRIRTADFLNAIEALYQLSYNPAKCTFYDALITNYLSIYKFEDV